MMYFLVSTPPKTFVAVSPAFSAISTKFAMFELLAASCVTFCEGREPPSKRQTTAVLSCAFRNSARGVLHLTSLKRSPRASGIASWISWHLFFYAVVRKSPRWNKKISDQIVRGLGRRFRERIRKFRCILCVTRPAIRLAEEPLRLYVSRLQSKRFSKFGDRFVHLPQRKLRLSQVYMSFRVFRL